MINTKNKLPKKNEITKWIKKIISKNKIKINIKIVTINKIRLINKKYRHKNKSTNIIAFKYKNKYTNDISGDLIICPEIIKKEALKNEKKTRTT